jgi:hypothetical protein
MKEEILTIISKKYSKIFYLTELLSFAEELMEYLESCKTQTEEVFLSFLNKYKFENLETFSEYEEYPYVTLSKSYDWTLAPVIDYEGGVTDVDQEIGIIFKDPEIYFKGEDTFEVTDEVKNTIILTWLSLMWFRIKGYSFGLVVKTLENNSCTSFYFNDLAWDSLSDYRNYNDKNKRLENYFSTDLDILMIYQRASLITYPVYPYINKWRYFKKDNVIIEFVSYGNETNEISSNSSTQNLKEHKTLFDTLKYEQERTLELTKQGFKEFLDDKRENNPIYEGAIETKFWSGEHWYYNEQQNRLSIEEIIEFENQKNISLPFYFKHYLRLFNGRKYNNINMNFYVGGDSIKIKEFYNLDEIKKLYTNGAQSLDIGILDDESKKLSLNLTTSKLALRENDKYIKEFNVDFETFILGPINYSR